MIVVTGSVTARVDSLGEVRKLSLEHVHRSRQEPGCISHAVHADCENPLRLVFIEQWADRAALLGAFRCAGFTQFCSRAAAAGRGRPHHRDLRRHEIRKLLNEKTRCIAGLPHQFHIAMQHHHP
jgi:quinol monooxygenase YgiN